MIHQRKKSPWTKIISLCPIKEYPVLPCPCCNGVSLKLDIESIRIKSIPQKVLEVENQRAAHLNPHDDLFIMDKSAQRAKSTDIAKVESSSHSHSHSHSKGGGGGSNGGDIFGLLFIGFVASMLLKDSAERDHMSMYQFCGFFECDGCENNVAVTGFYEGTKGQDSVDQNAGIKVDHFSQIIPLMSVSDNVPDSIKYELFHAFKHFHFDPPSAASKIRRAVEQFCEDMDATGNNLHHKIKSLEKKRPEEAEYLIALKLLGNEGTHAHDVSEVDLLHAFDVFQYVLELYDRKARFDETQGDYRELDSKYNNK